MKDIKRSGRWIGAAVMLALALADSGYAQAVAREATPEGRRVLQLENEMLRLTFDPALGGRAYEAFFKPAGKDMASKIGLFGEMMPGFAQTTEAQVVEPEGDRASLRFVARGAKPPLWNLKFTRTVALERAGSSVRVTLEMANEGKTALPFVIRPHNGLVFPGEAEDAWYYIPSERGVTVGFDYQPRPGERVGAGGHGSSEHFEKEPVAGWIGARSVSGLATAVVMDWSLMDMAFCWLDKFPGATAEWGMNELELKPGESFTSSYLWTFFRDMNSVYGASEDAAVGIETPKEVKPDAQTPIKVSVASGRALGEVEVELLLRTQPDEADRSLGKQKVKLAAAVGQTAAFQAAFSDNATHVLTAVARLAGREIVRGARVVTLGRSPRGYLASRPAAAKRGQSHWGLKLAKAMQADAPLPGHYSVLDLETKTPHVKLMRPNALGTARVLFVNRPDFFKYSVREMHQRFDLQPDYVLAYCKARAGVFLLDEYREDVLKNLAQAVQDDRCDVVFLSSVKWAWIPKPLINDLLEKVRGGMGLVFTGTADQQPLLGALTEAKAEKTPDQVVARSSGLFRKQEPVEGVRLNPPTLYTLGKGRVVHFPMAAVFGAYDSFLPNAGYAEGPEFPWWDHVYAAYGRAISWASKKDAGVLVEPTAVTEKTVKVRVTAPDGVEVARLRLWVLDDRLNVVTSKDVTPSKDETSAEWPQTLFQGRYTLDAVAEDTQGRSLGFGQAMFTIKPKIQIAVKLDRSRMRGEERPKATVKARTDEPFEGRAEATFVDRFGRTLFRETRPARLGPEPASFAFDLASVRPVTASHHFVFTVLGADGKATAQAREEVRIFPQRPRVEDDFVGAMWGTAGRGPYARTIVERALSAGLTFGYMSPNVLTHTTPSLGVEMGLEYWALDVGQPGVRDYKVDPNTKMAAPSPWAKEELDKLAANARKYGEMLSRELGVDNYILQDEYASGHLHEDRSPATLHAFRDFLRRSYPSLDALNKQWETSFKTWDEAGYPPAKNASAENDWEAFWCGLLTLRVKTVRDAIREVNPRARAGMSGTQRPTAGKGYDYRELMQVAEFMTRYNHLQEDFMESFGTKNLFQGQWRGYGSRSEGRARQDLWNDLLHGGHFTAYYKLMIGVAPNQEMSVVDHNVALVPFYAFVGDELRRIGSGLGRLILACEAEFDPVAIYHSQRTNLATGIEAYPIKRMLEDGGFRFTVVDSRDAVAGALKTGRVRAVWLPQITCVGADERDALRAFVEAGGVLIADQKCGERDGRAKPLAGPGMLDDLFGLKREPSAGAPQPAPFAPTDDAGPRTRSWKGMQIVAVSHGLTPDSGKAWLRSDKGAPAVIVNRVGRGAAVFVNMDFNNYAATASGGVGGEVSRDTQGAAEYVDSCVDLVQALMEDLASLKPVASMKVGGRTVSDACSFRFRRGGLRLVAFMARQGTPEKIEPKLILQADYTLPAEAQVYELRAEGKGFGRTASVKASLVPCVPTVFAMLPYEVAGVRLSAPAEAKAGRVLRVEGAIQPAGGVAPELHSVRVEAFRPDGSRFDGFCANLLTDRGGFAHEMPLALDDPAGAWKVVATDVISRRSAEAVVRVTTP